MKKFDTLDKRISIIQQVIADNELVLEKDIKEIVAIIDGNELFIDSSDLELGDRKNIIFYEQREKYDEEHMVSRITKAINFEEYEMFEIVVFVHTVEEKIRVSENVKKKIGKFFKTRRKSNKIWKFNVQFVGDARKQSVSIGVDSTISILDYEHKNPNVEGQVYNASLYDIVGLYNVVGDLLFKDNVREKIEDVLNVDIEIEKTLDEAPEKFWFFNNGITLMIDNDRVVQRREFQLDIDLANGVDISVINGAQTISVAALYYYKLINYIDNEEQKEDLEEKLHKAKKAQVLLRIIRKEKNKGEIDFYKEISVSLNRQKAINDADIRYTDYLVDDINNLSEGREEPFFFIDKREDKTRKKISRHYSLERFVKISAIYLLQEPGSARASKGKYIKQDTQWERLNISKRGELNEEMFLKKYRPYIFVDKLFVKLNDRLSYAEKQVSNGDIKNIYKYGSEFLCAYIVWVANGKIDDDFSKFPEKYNLDENKLFVIINEFAKATLTCFENDVIDSNLFKKDKKYIELRETLDQYEAFGMLIMKLFT